MIDRRGACEMKRPTKLYRYRPLDDSLIDRELRALQNSYLWSPPFSAMNDPMEAFFELGGPADPLIDAMLARSGKGTADMYSILKETVDRFCLVSFASSHMNLPMWAYYASNYRGMCLEFDTADLFIGDFQTEPLRPVTYAENALAPIEFAKMLGGRVMDAVIDRLTRKRIEWSPENEWRILTGEGGAKHYLDDALRRVFLGHRVKSEHATRVCAALDRRPVEVLQGSIRGYELTFHTLKPVRPHEQCERVGAGRFDRAEHLYAANEVAAFLLVPFDRLVDTYRRIAFRPNLEEICDVNIASNNDAVYLWTKYKLRSGRYVYHRCYFDRHLRLLPDRHDVAGSR
jgi:Protein of unknown function (DUF2971)